MQWFLKPDFRVPGVQWKNGLQESHFLPTFYHIWWFFKVLRNFGKPSNMPKFWQKMKKSLCRLAFNPFFSWLQVPKSRILATHSATSNYTYTHYFYSTVSIPLIFWKNKKPNNCFPIINIVMLAIRQWTDLKKKLLLRTKKKIRIKIFNF